MTARIDLRGARALVTGATGGLGQAIARKLAQEGSDLVLSGRRLDVLEPLAAELGAQAIAAELGDLAEVDRPMDEAGPIDLLVANAALSASGNLLEYTPEQIHRNLTVNLHSQIVMTRAAALGMVERGRGHIVLIGSLSGRAASLEASLYNATKFGLRGFALGFRQDLADRNVGVSIVEPGFVRDAGMFADSGAPLPPGVRTVPPEAVAEAIVRAIERNRAEVDAAPFALRAGARIAGVAPVLAGTVSKRLGGSIARAVEQGHSERR